MNTINNAFPRAVILGIQDLSGTTPVYETTPVPTHLPLCHIYAQWGSEDTLLLSGDAVSDTYGADTFNPRKPYYNHATAFLDVFRARQTVQVKRIVPDDAKTARLMLSLDIVAEESARSMSVMPDGSFKRDNAGNKIPTGTKIAGYKARWVLNDWAITTSEDAPFGQMTQKVGGLVSTSSEQSVQYPILDLQVPFRGKRGNNFGMRLWAPTTSSADALDEALVEQIKAYLYRIQLTTRADENSSSLQVETLGAAQYINTTLKPDQLAQGTDQALSMGDIFLDSYQRLGTPGVPNQYGPFHKLKIYDGNLNAVLAMVGEAEAPNGILHPDVLEMDADSEWLHLVNIFTAQNTDGVPYAALQLLGPADGGVLMNENSTLYAAGGSDGTMSPTAFDTAVRDEFNKWLSPSYALHDTFRYPVSAVWDPGYNLETKKAMFNVLKRADVGLIVSTQDVSLPQNSDAADDSMAIALRAVAAGYPESVFYGTKVARVMIHAQSGYLINSQYKKLLPLAYQLAVKTSDYMGAASGTWNEALAYDQEGNNLVTLFRDINNTWRPANARKADWENGLIWVQSFDHMSYFYPGVQTAYDDDSSVLNSSINMWVAIEGIKACLRSWRSVTGNSKLTPDQVVARLDTALTDDMATVRFGNRFTIVPQTYYTANDRQRGFSYSSKLHIYAPNMVSVGQYTVTMHRKADLESAAA